MPGTGQDRSPNNRRSGQCLARGLKGGLGDGVAFMDVDTAALLAVAGDPDAYPKQPNPLFALWSIGCIMGFTKSLAAARQRVRG